MFSEALRGGARFVSRLNYRWVSGNINAISPCQRVGQDKVTYRRKMLQAGTADQFEPVALLEGIQGMVQVYHPSMLIPLAG